MITLKPNTEYDQNSVTANSSAEINRLSSELNSRISREMDEMMNSVSVQIQRAINNAISTQVLPQIQNAIMAGSGHRTRKGWDAPSERPELNSEVQRNLHVKSNSRNEQNEDQLNNDYPDLNVHDNSIQKLLPTTCCFLSRFLSVRSFLLSTFKVSCVFSVSFFSSPPLFSQWRSCEMSNQSCSAVRSLVCFEFFMFWTHQKVWLQK